MVYTNAILGHATLVAGDEGTDLQPLFDTIVSYLPAPTIEPNAPLQMLVSTLGYDDYKGRIAIGRIVAGTIRKAQDVKRIAVDGSMSSGKIAQVFVHQGLDRLEVDEATAGEIVAITGLPEIYIGETIADPIEPKALPPIRVEEPTVRMTFGVNTSPFTGREGTWSTSRKLRERLDKELEHNVSLQVADGPSPDTFIVSGRGELHLVILIETMRREGYEFQVGKPEVILRQENGQLLEPVEEVYIEVPEDVMGTVVEMLGNRRGQMTDIRHGEHGTVYLTYLVPTRGLLGFRGAFLTATRGTGIMHALFHGYEPMAGEIATRERGSMVAWEDGMSTAYALHNAEERGILFIGPGVEVYEGMIVGQNARGNDMPINVAKKKHLTNIRASVEDIAVRLTPPKP